MKKIFLLLLTLFCIHSVFAQNAESNLQDLSLKINLDLQNGNNKNKFLLDNKIKFSKEDHLWFIVPNSGKNQNDPILLAKVEKYNTTSAKLNFLLIDPTKKNEIIARPVIIAAYNQTAKLVVTGPNSKMEFNVLATI